MVVAVVDAVRRDGEPAQLPAATELENRRELAAQLAALGARGELALHDEACGVQLLSLPSLEQRSEIRGDCTPGASALTVDVQGRRPDGTLTFAREEGVVTARGTVLVPRTELELAARLHPDVPDRGTRVRALVDGVAWVSDTRAAVAISIRVGAPVDLGGVGTIAFFEDGRLLPTPQPQLRNIGLPLAASPRGTYVTQTADIILRADGSLLTLPDHLRDARALAWSPDERFLALATRFAVVILPVASLERFDRTGGGLRSVTILQPAADLSWRP